VGHKKKEIKIAHNKLLKKFKRFVGPVFVVVMIALVFFIREDNFVASFLSSPVEFVFVGDIMLSRQIGKIIDREDNPNFPFARMVETIQEADIAFGNLETPISTRGVDQGSIYSFRADPRVILGLKWAGFDVLSIANNHTFDWGDDAFLDTRMHLEAQGISTIGGGKDYDEAHSHVRFEKKGQVFCFLGYSEFTAGRGTVHSGPAMARLNKEQIIADIKNAKDYLCEVTIVSLHWGEEYKTNANWTQKDLARSFIDAGAKIVVGHHPHVVQEIEEYNEGLIAYSLGNFIFDQNFSHDTRQSVVLSVILEKNQIKTVTPIPIKFTDKFEPYIFDKL
jgi:poly-gamma-glutamate synthesis protein (capsule biosynthesis protein)